MTLIRKGGRRQRGSVRSAFVPIDRRRDAVPDSSRVEALLREPLLSWPGASPVAVREVVESAPAVGVAILAVAVNAAGPGRRDLTEQVVDALSEAVAATYPAWLPEAEQLAGPGGAGLAALRAICARAAGGTDLFGPFLLAAAAAALCGRPFVANEFARETAVREARKLILRACGQGRLVVMVELTGTWSPAQIEAVETNALWLSGPGELTVWLFGTPTARLTRAPRSAFHGRQPASDPPAAPHPPYLTPLRGRPNAFSRAETCLETHLARCPWAAGRAWNQTWSSACWPTPSGSISSGRARSASSSSMDPTTWTRTSTPPTACATARCSGRASWSCATRTTRCSATRRAFSASSNDSWRTGGGPRHGRHEMGYGIPERAAMIALMALNRETPNSELKRRYGLDVRRPAREKLNLDGLVQSRSLGRKGFAHELTDAGWAWAVAELDESVPPRAGSAGGALYALLNGLKVALDARGMVIQDLFAPPAPESAGSLRGADSGGLPQPRVPAVGLGGVARSPGAARRLARAPRWTWSSPGCSARRTSTSRCTRTAAGSPRPTRDAALRLGVDDMHLISME